jgi:hypothetical protein
MFIVQAIGVVTIDVVVVVVAIVGEIAFSRSDCLFRIKS